LVTTLFKVVLLILAVQTLKATSVVDAIAIGYDSVISNASLEGCPEHGQTRKSDDPHWAVASSRVRDAAAA
jgi:hypothetical protein